MAAESRSNKTSFWRADLEHARRISFLLLEADKLSVEVGLLKPTFYYPYFLLLKAVYRNLKPLLINLKIPITNDVNLINDLDEKCFNITKKPNEVDNLAQALIEVARELDELHDVVLSGVDKSGLYFRTVTTFKDIPYEDRIKRASRHGRE